MTAILLITLFMPDGGNLMFEFQTKDMASCKEVKEYILTEYEAGEGVSVVAVCKANVRNF